MSIKYAKYISPTKIIRPVASDLNDDGSPINPENWMILYETEKPQETMFDKYICRYEIIENQIWTMWDHIHIEPEGDVAKLDGDKIIYPQNREKVGDSYILNYDKLPNSIKLSHGWYLVEDTPVPNDDKNYESYGIYEDHPDYGKIIKIHWREVQKEEYIPTEHDIRVEALREKYRQTTRLLCQLAGVDIVDKLEDVEYETTVIAAMTIDPGQAAMLTQTIMYCFFQLKLEDGIDAWIRI
mgnify:CR=1 FL=1